MSGNCHLIKLRFITVSLRTGELQFNRTLFFSLFDSQGAFLEVLRDMSYQGLLPGLVNCRANTLTPILAPQDLEFQTFILKQGLIFFLNMSRSEAFTLMQLPIFMLSHQQSYPPYLLQYYCSSQHSEGKKAYSSSALV